MARLAVRKLPQWSARAEAGLSETLRGEEAEIARQVNEGIAELFEFENDTFMVTRIEAGETLPSELVVMCLQGQGLNRIAPWTINLARANDMASIRVHTQRLGLGRALRRYGFRELERVYRLDLGN